jgi:hypothetical protein
MGFALERDQVKRKPVRRLDHATNETIWSWVDSR